MRSFRREIEGIVDGVLDLQKMELDKQIGHAGRSKDEQKRLEVAVEEQTARLKAQAVDLADLVLSCLHTVAVSLETLAEYARWRQDRETGGQTRPR